jgi:hypothetical protein
VATAEWDFEPDDVERSSVSLVAPELAQLRLRLKATCQGNLDAVAGCTHVKRDEVVHGPDSNGNTSIESQEMCGILCGEEDRACDFCSRVYRCVWLGSPAGHPFGRQTGTSTRCERCRVLICVDCKATHAGRASGTAWRCPSCL